MPEAGSPLGSRTLQNSESFVYVAKPNVFVNPT